VSELRSKGKMGSGQKKRKNLGNKEGRASDAVWKKKGLPNVGSILAIS